MAYDLMVGKGIRAKEAPIIVASIEFDELPIICALLKKQDHFFLNRMTNLFEDQSFSVEELQQAKTHLLALLPLSLECSQKALLHKFISVVCYAVDKDQPLFGVAD